MFEVCSTNQFQMSAAQWEMDFYYVILRQSAELHFQNLLSRSYNLNFYLFTQHDMEAKTKSHQENKHQQSKLTNFKEYLSEHHKEYAKREWKLF